MSCKVWTTYKWGEIATLEYGKALRDYKDRSDGYPVYGTNGPIGWNEEPLCRHPGVIIGRKGAYRGIHYSKQPFYVIDTAFYVNPKLSIDLKWAYYCLQTYDINGMDSGSAIPSLSRDAFYQLLVELPPYLEQHAIARMLSSLDDKIELNNRMNKTLEGIAQTLFKRWFVDFEFPDENGYPYKSSGGKMVESELGLIPEGWTISPLEDLCSKITKGTTPTTMKKQYTLSGINFIKAESITDAHLFDKGKFAFIDSETNQMFQRSIVAGNDLLFTIAGTIGRFAIVTKNILPANTNQAVAIIRVNKAKLHPYYLLCLFLCGQHKQFLESKVVHAVQANLSLGIISTLPIIVSDSTIHSVFINQITPVLSQLFNNYQENESLTQLRNSLLPKLMSGEIRVPITEE